MESSDSVRAEKARQRCVRQTQLLVRTGTSKAPSSLVTWFVLRWRLVLRLRVSRRGCRRRKRGQTAASVWGHDIGCAKGGQREGSRLDCLNHGAGRESDLSSGVRVAPVRQCGRGVYVWQDSQGRKYGKTARDKLVAPRPRLHYRLLTLCPAQTHAHARAHRLASQGRACCGACCGARVCACVGCQVACPCCRAACTRTRKGA